MEEGKRAIVDIDSFIAAQSEFDRSARLQTKEHVELDAYLDFLSMSVREWNESETQIISRILNLTRDKFSWMHGFPLPSKVLIVKTSGLEEGAAAYTRRNDVIVFPENYLVKSEKEIYETMVHEFFHVASKFSSTFREAVYKLISYIPLGQTICYPPSLQNQRITNPDGPVIDFHLQVTAKFNNVTYDVVPILYADRPYDGGVFFSYMKFRLMAITKEGGSWQPLHENDKPMLLVPTDTDYVARIGHPKHTYIIHPDEISATNFQQFAVSFDVSTDTVESLSQTDKLLFELLSVSWA
eukprot:GILJ01004573.1.p1 GENE.GILJ01004573.1~~GILJ01004573.1.p1  ORF type:complete len:330 (-),score=34.27 GILJ01004573.1:201-1091(-)